MSTTFDRCPVELFQMRDEILITDAEIGEALLQHKVRIDLVFAAAERDPNTDERLADAITHQGRRAYGLASIRNAKLRALMPYDGEILIDRDWWDSVNERQQEALLAHELYHFVPKMDATGSLVVDDAGRPKLKLREHDFEVGWFAHIASRYGSDSVERAQARQVVEENGQAFWPDLCRDIVPIGGAMKKFVDGIKKSATTVTISSGDKSVTIGGEDEQKAAAKGGGK